MRKLLLLSTILITFALLSGCSKDNKSEQKSEPVVKNSLPEKIDQLGLVRDGEAKKYIGQDLFEYINGGAEVYHLYGFVEVQTAYYKLDTTEIVIDLYQFDSPVQAYGLYASLRPDNPNFVNLGVEGIRSPNRIEFVKGKYMIRLTAFDEAGDVLLDSAAVAMNQVVEGSDLLPEKFSLFPVDDMLVSAKFYPTSYLGHQFLVDVYTASYFDPDEPMTLFLTDDESGKKYINFASAAAEQSITLPDKFGFDGQQVVAIKNSYYGTIIFGLKGGYLVGCVNYKDQYRQKLTDWLSSLP